MDPARLLMIDLAGPRPTPDERALLAERRVGGVCLFSRNLTDRVQAAELTEELRALAGAGLIVGIDQEGGGVVRLRDLPFPPGAMALGAADDPELTRRVAAATGRGLRAIGVTVDFAPVADVNVEPANPVIGDRAFGGDPARVARHVVAFVEGLQGEGVAATVKHFPGHGDTALDSHLALPVLRADRARLERVELEPFRAAFRAGVAAVMSGHLLVPALDPEWPATLSPAIMTGLLRDELGFRGAAFTDALNMRAVAERWGPEEAALRTVLAGVDMPLHIGPPREHAAICDALAAALAEGRLAPERVREAAARLDALVEAHPSRPDPGAAWRDGDEALLDEAAARALLARGRLPRLAPGDAVLLVAAERTRASAASDLEERPAAVLAAALEAAGVRVRLLPYERGAPLAAREPARAAAAEADLVLFASVARTRPTEAERALARSLAGAGRPFAHVALWNPYALADLPGPALASFGFRPPSARAAAAALLGARAPGRAPAGGLEPAP